MGVVQGCIHCIAGSGVGVLSTTCAAIPGMQVVHTLVVPHASRALGLPGLWPYDLLRDVIAIATGGI